MNDPKLRELAELDDELSKHKTHSLRCIRGEDPKCYRCFLMQKAAELRKELRRKRGRKCKYDEKLVLRLWHEEYTIPQIMRTVRDPHGRMPSGDIVKRILKRNGINPSERGF